MPRHTHHSREPRRTSHLEYNKNNATGDNTSSLDNTPVYRRQFRDVCVQTFPLENSKTNISLNNQPGNRSQFRDIGIQTENSQINSSDETNEQGNQPQTLGPVTASTNPFKPKEFIKQKKRFKSNMRTKSKSTFKLQDKPVTESYNIKSLNIPPENLLHCKFHVNGQPLTLLIDTGAAISVIRKDRIGNNSIDSKNKVSIIGVSNTKSTIQTYGTSEISLDLFPTHKFHIADINIVADGILGNDFMSKFNAHIYVQSKTMRIRDISYKLFFLGEEHSKQVTHTQIIPKRSDSN